MPNHRVMYEPADLFTEHVERIVEVPWSGCWIWTGATFSRAAGVGYGCVEFEGKTQAAHRIAWRASHGRRPPKGMVVRHTCDVPCCINPAHLVLGTYQQNSNDAIERGQTLRGSRHPQAILTEAQVKIIKKRCGNGSHQRVVAKDFGVSQGTVARIMRGKIWRHV